MNKFEKIVVALLGAIAIAGTVTAVEVVRMARNGFNMTIDVEQAQEILDEANKAKAAAFEDMESAVAAFDNRFADYDFSSLTIDQIVLLERRLTPYPTAKIERALRQAKAEAIERENKEQQRRLDRIQARYGYYGREDATKGLGMLEIKAYERATIKVLYDIMTEASEAEIREAIKRHIPPITDEEIDAYRSKEKEKLHGSDYVRNGC